MQREKKEALASARVSARADIWRLWETVFGVIWAKWLVFPVSYCFSGVWLAVVSCLCLCMQWSQGWWRQIFLDAIVVGCYCDLMVHMMLLGWRIFFLFSVQCGGYLGVLVEQSLSPFGACSFAFGLVWAWCSAGLFYSGLKDACGHLVGLQRVHSWIYCVIVG